MIAVTIVAALAAVVFLTMIEPAIQRSKQKRTMADMRTIANALEARASDTNEYPAVASVDALVPLLVPKYVTKLPRVDGWGRPFRYSASGGVYTIISAARDGVFEKSSAKDYPGGLQESFDADIVYSNGTFIQYPPGVGRN